MVHAYKTPSNRQVLKKATPLQASAMDQDPLGRTKYAPSRYMGTPEARMPSSANFALHFTKVGTSGLHSGSANISMKNGKAIADNQRNPSSVSTAIGTIASTANCVKTRVKTSCPASQTNPNPISPMNPNKNGLIGKVAS